MQYIHVPFVLACLDGLLGSPVPMVLLARTRNSYSTHGFRSITVAVSWWPPTISGTGKKKTKCANWVSRKLCVHLFCARARVCFASAPECPSGWQDWSDSTTCRHTRCDISQGHTVHIPATTATATKTLQRNHCSGWASHSCGIQASTKWDTGKIASNMLLFICRQSLPPSRARAAGYDRRPPLVRGPVVLCWLTSAALVLADGACQVPAAPVSAELVFTALVLAETVSYSKSRASGTPSPVVLTPC